MQASLDKLTVRKVHFCDGGLRVVVEGVLHTVKEAKDDKQNCNELSVGDGRNDFVV